MSTYNIGQANANALAIGDNAQANNGSVAPDPLDQLAAAVRDSQSLLGDPAEVDRALRELRQLVAKGAGLDDLQPQLALIVSNARQAPTVLAAAAGLRRTGSA